jgi:GTPase SAR1 family protein
MSKKTREIKVVLLGDSSKIKLWTISIGVGKSSILLRFVANTFDEI